MREQQENWRKNLAHHDYRQFLNKFKVQPCHDNSHYDQFCFGFHTDFKEYESSHSTISTETFYNATVFYRDRRRTPYGPLNQILYVAEYCPCVDTCKDQSCRYCHNSWELSYHPLVYKTLQCQYYYDCSYEFCNRIHDWDIMINPKNQIPMYRFSEFFRFDILTFKTKPCKKQYGHDKNSCLFFHNQKDFRRPNFDSYDHIECKKASGSSCFNKDCEFAHNKIQQLYHPSRYKSKFCQKHYISRKNAPDPNDEASFKSLCPYGKFCSFAHNKNQISIQLIDQWPKNLEFYLYAYKTVWCPITTDHNRSQCVYAHNIQDYRRNPREHYYEDKECPFWKKNENIKSLEEAGCPEGMDCQKCHGWKQWEYHPMIYCKDHSSSSKLKENGESVTASDVAKEKTQSSNGKDIRHSDLQDQIISKKLGTEFCQKSKMEAIVEQKLTKGNSQFQRQAYAPGTPFFKNIRNGKIKSQSEKGEISKSQQEEKTSQVQERGSYLTAEAFCINSAAEQSNPFIYSIDIEDTAIFKVFQGPVNPKFDEISSGYKTDQNESENEREKPKQRLIRTISKSVQCGKSKSQTKYSKDLNEVLNPNILKILQQKKISQIKLVNMREQDIHKIKELTTSQKSLIINKIITNRAIDKKTPTYEQIFEKFFIKHRRKELLGKIKHRKVEQEKLLLMDKEIKDMSFLTSSEKRILPSIINEFKDNKDFNSLNQDIFKCLTKDPFA